MTKTDHYNLCQWDATDPIRREDFNRDNAAIDAALGEAAGAVPYVVGKYESTNSGDNDVVVDLGFQPSMVIIAKPGDNTGEYGTTCTRDLSAVVYGKTVAAVTESGFIAGLAFSNGRVAPPYTNYSGPFAYIAFR